jgi:hypothetical protein
MNAVFFLFRVRHGHIMFCMVQKVVNDSTNRKKSTWWAWSMFNLYLLLTGIQFETRLVERKFENWDFKLKFLIF